VIKGGVASLPFGEDLGIVGFPRPQGQAYGCMAEAMLLGFQGVRDRTFTGHLTPEHVAKVSSMAARHGFKLAGYKHACVHGYDCKEIRYADAR
jgi:predicted amino acid dehydrogenase